MPKNSPAGPPPMLTMFMEAASSPERVASR
jgi:hypothetical protein